MTGQCWKLWMRGTAVAALLCWGANAGAQTPRVILTPPVTVSPGASEDGAPLVVDTTMRSPEIEGLLRKMQQAKFWIGVECSPLDEALKSQLKLDHGVVVRALLAESPASKTDLEVFDILLQLGDEKLRDVGHLIDVIDANGAKEATLRVLRGGKERTVQITPAKRPDRAAEDAEALEAHVRNSLSGLPEKIQKDVRIMVVRPGTVFKPGLAEVKLPEGMSISISKSGDKPATIDVQQGDKKWSVTEDELDKLPPEIRVHVERMRGEMVHLPIPPQAHDAAAAGKAYTRRLEVMPGATPGEAVAPRIKMRSIPAVPGQPPQLAELHKKMDQMLKAVREQAAGQGSIDQLQKEIDRLRQDVDALQKQLKERH